MAYQWRMSAPDMLHYAAADLAPAQRYKLLVGFVVPRPIAWVTTLGPTGVVNAAPFSFFNVVCDEPPLIAISVNQRSDGRLKDTRVNIDRAGEWVVNIVDEAMAEAMHRSSGDFPPEIGEPQALGLELDPSSQVAPPRIRGVPFAMECRLWRAIEVGPGRQIVIGEAVHFHVREDVIDPTTLRLRDDVFQPVGRMFGDRYVRTGDRFSFPPAKGRG